MNNKITIIILLGLIARIFFLVMGASIYYKTSEYMYDNFQFVNMDTFSYSQSFLNLYYKGFFSFDLNNPDAAFGRLPGYPIFWGIHYIIFGVKYVYQAVAISQLLLDTLAIYLVFSLTKKISNNDVTAYIAAFIYALNPFIIVWITITGTESFACFLTILFFYTLYCYSDNKFKPYLIGLLIAMSFYTREYLAVLLIPACIYYFQNYKIKIVIINSLITIFTFTVLYSFWPIRNYVNYNRFILLKTPTSGYDRYGEDIIAMRSWIYSFSPDADFYLDKITKTNDTVIFPNYVFKNENEKRLAITAIEKARKCGTGTYNWLYNTKYPHTTNCNNEIKSSFDFLTNSFKNSHTFQFFTQVPLLNLQKAFFKSKLANIDSNSIKAKFTNLLFLFRSVLVCLGFGIIFIYFRAYKCLPMLVFCIFMYTFICFFVRQVEMRYLIQADVILIILSSLSINYILININKMVSK